MQNENFIDVVHFCRSHEIEESLLFQLQEFGLVEITTVEERAFFPVDQLPALERLVRLAVDLDINVEGIDAIRHLVDRVRELENENRVLRRKLGFYETDETGPQEP